MPFRYIPEDSDNSKKFEEDEWDRLYRQLGPWTKIGDGLWAGSYQPMGLTVRHIAE